MTKTKTPDVTTLDVVITRREYNKLVKDLPTTLRKAYRYALTDEADGSYVALDLVNQFAEVGRLHELVLLVQSGSAHDIPYADSLCDAVAEYVKDVPMEDGNHDITYARRLVGAPVDTVDDVEPAHGTREVTITISQADYDDMTAHLTAGRPGRPMVAVVAVKGGK